MGSLIIILATFILPNPWVPSIEAFLSNAILLLVTRILL